MTIQRKVFGQILRCNTALSLISAKSQNKRRNFAYPHQTKRCHLTSAFLLISATPYMCHLLEIVSYTNKFNNMNTEISCEKVKDKDARTTSMASLWCRLLWTYILPASSVSTVDFDGFLSIW